MKWSINKRKNRATSPTAPECHKLELYKAFDMQKFQRIVPELIVIDTHRLSKPARIVQRTQGKILILQILCYYYCMANNCYASEIEIYLFLVIKTYVISLFERTHFHWEYYSQYIFSQSTNVLNYAVCVYTIEKKRSNKLLLLVRKILHKGFFSSNFGVKIV